MLCHAALISCTYIAPTAIAINPMDPTRWAEPCCAARAPSVETSQLFARTSCKSNIVRLDNKTLICQERPRNKKSNKIIFYILSNHLLYSIEDLLYRRLFCTDKPSAYSCTLITRCPGQMGCKQLCSDQQHSLTTLFLQSFATVYEGSSVSLANELTVVKIRFKLSRLCVESMPPISAAISGRGGWLGLNTQIIQQ